MKKLNILIFCKNPTDYKVFQKEELLMKYTFTSSEISFEEWFYESSYKENVYDIIILDLSLINPELYSLFSSVQLLHTLIFFQTEEISPLLRTSLSEDFVHVIEKTFDSFLIDSTLKLAYRYKHLSNTNSEKSLNFSSLCESVPSGIVLLDADGTILNFNESFRIILSDSLAKQFDRKELFNTAFFNLIDDQSQKLLQEQIINIQSNPNIHYRDEYKLYSKDNQLNEWIICTIFSTPNTINKSIYITLQNYTSEKVRKQFYELEKKSIGSIARGVQAKDIIENLLTDINRILPSAGSSVLLKGFESKQFDENSILYTNKDVTNDLRLFFNEAGKEIEELLRSHLSDESKVANGDELIQYFSKKDLNVLREIPISTLWISSVTDEHGEILALLTNYIIPFRQPKDYEVDIVNSITHIITLLIEREHKLLFIEKKTKKQFAELINPLPAHVFRVGRDDDNRFYYIISEGKLAQETNLIVHKKTYIDSLLDSSTLKEITPKLLQAFHGESLCFKEKLNDRSFITHYEPIFENGEVQYITGASIEISLQSHAEQELLASNDRYKLIIDSLPAGVLRTTIHKDQRVEFSILNETGKNILGENFTDLDKNISAIYFNNKIHPLDKQHFVSAFESWISDEATMYLNTVYRFRYGNSYLWLDNYFIKYYNIEKQETEITHMFFDITQRIQSEQELVLNKSRLDLLIEMLPAAITRTTFQHDGTSYTTILNNRGKELFGNYFLSMEYQYTPERYIHPDDLPHVSKLFKEWFDNTNLKEPIRTEYRFRETPDTYRWLENFCVKYRDTETGLLEMTQMIFDITERKNIEEELQEAYNRERTLNALKVRFVNTVSHEFRTPLTGILINAQLLRNYSNRISKEEQDIILKKIEQRVQELTELMDDFIKQSSVDTIAGLYSPVTIDIHEFTNKFVQKSLPKISDNYPSHHFALSLQEKYPEFAADVRLLEYICINLISNAYKYSTSGSNILLSIVSDSSNIILTIEDNGIGIPEEDLPNVFEPFYRGSNTHEIHGTGLGLSIVRDFVELHQGSIHVESKQHEFTKFTVILPYKIS